MLTDNTNIETKITTANTKVTLGYNGNFFGIELSLENENGIELSEINRFRSEAYDLVKHAIDEHKNGERGIKDNMPTFDPDKNLDELLKKANSKKAKP